MGFRTELLTRLDCDCCGVTAGSDLDAAALWAIAEVDGWTRSKEGYWCPACAAPEHHHIATPVQL